MPNGFEEYANKSLSAEQVKKLLTTYVEYCHSMGTIRKALNRTFEWELGAREVVGHCVRMLCEILDEDTENVSH